MPLTLATIFARLLVGAFFGLVVGGFVGVFAEEVFIHRERYVYTDDFRDAQRSFMLWLVIGSSTAFAIIAVLLGGRQLPSAIKGVTYGAVVGVGIGVVFAQIVASLRHDHQPFDRITIEALRYGPTVGALLGALAGLVICSIVWRRPSRPAAVPNRDSQ